MPRCLFPRIINNPAYSSICGNQSQKLIVPCGKCINCLKSRRAEWAFRLRSEFINSECAFFVTLSEDDKHLHALNKSDLQKLFKCMRKAGYKFTYYAIGEYGSKKGRPHYHIMFFFKHDVESYDFMQYISKYWHMGNVEVSECNFVRIEYITHYHIRPKNPKNAQFSERTFQLMSKGIGLQFITPERLAYFKLSDDNVVNDVFGNRVNLPRYYRKKFDIPSKNFDCVDDMIFVTQVARARGYRDEFEYLRDIKGLNEFYLKKYSNQESF